MDKLTFLAQVIKATAWPIAVVSLVCVFRPQIGLLLGRLREAGLGNAKLSFQEGVDIVRQALPAPDGTATKAATDAVEKAIRLGVSPAQIIDEAFNKLEEQLREIATKKDIGDGRGLFKKAEMIVPRLGLEPTVAPLVWQLRLLRDQAKEAGNATTIDAIHFQEAVSEIKDQLSKL